ncbi:MAG: protein kinase [Prevotella sp.]|nr:protein kinase [Prevotella sp.]
MDSSSASGIIRGSFDGLDLTFADVEVLRRTRLNVVARGRRYGRLWLLKAPADPADEAMRRQLRKELEVMLMLCHPSVAAAAALEEVEGLGPCIIMEWVEGTTLDRWLEAHGCGARKRSGLCRGDSWLSERRRAAVALAEAVAYLHSRGVVHRDLKPQNIMVRPGGGIVIIDFGLADTPSHLTLKQSAGTPRYMAPEQHTAALSADPRNDIYSLGVIYREMRLGWPAVVSRCLMPIDRRWQSAAALAAAMRRRLTRPRTALWVALAALLVALLTAAAVVVGYGQAWQDANGQSEYAQAQPAAQPTAQESAQPASQPTTQESARESAQPMAQPPSREPAQLENRQEFVYRCFRDGLDSLRRAVRPAAPTTERLRRGHDAISRFMADCTDGLTPAEQGEVRMRLDENLVAFRRVWLYNDSIRAAYGQ